MFAMGRADEARDAARVALSTAACWDTVGTERGGAAEMAALAGLDARMGARELREMLETGGEAHKAAAAAMAGRIPEDVGASGGPRGEGDLLRGGVVARGRDARGGGGVGRGGSRVGG